MSASSPIHLRALLCALALCALAAAPNIARAQPVEARARIVAPAEGQPARGTVAIVGSATSPAFSRYEIAYAAEPDASAWVSLGGAVQPIENGQLGIWDTRPLADGAYALRLQVIGADGSVSEAIVRNISVSNAAAAPAPAAAGTGATTGQGSGVVAEVQTARNTLEVVAATIGEIPDALLRGARLALLAFAALGAYVVIKKLVLYVAHRATRRPTDYGR